jgi:hypothetical protein
MTIKKINDLFTQEELDYFYSVVNETLIPLDESGNLISFQENDGSGVSKELGRLQVSGLTNSVSFGLKQKLVKIANESSDVELDLSHGVYAEYSGKYGKPNLPPHFDHDTNDLIINFQLESNTSWDLGIDLQLYQLEDNSAVLFNGNTNIHWRPYKTFKDDEYVKMIFFRFCKKENPSDYTHLDYTLDNRVFKKVNEFRDRIRDAS